MSASVRHFGVMGSYQERVPTSNGKSPRAHGATPIKRPFGGHIVVDSDNKLVGVIVDLHGIADIVGKFVGDQLTFIKTHRNPSRETARPVHYVFTKNWEGCNGFYQFEGKGAKYPATLNLTAEHSESTF